MSTSRRIAVVGLGYVGLPVLVAFAKKNRNVIGFDIDAGRIEELRGGADSTLEVTPGELAEAQARFTADPADLRDSDFFIVAVPTPVDGSNSPDLGALRAASRTVGGALKKGDIVVYESTVYPGATEEECAPILEAVSGLRCGSDFTIGYSPERINPGDKERSFTTIRKVVSGQDAPTTQIVAEVYASVVTAGVHVAPTIKVAEAAKVIENAQRDINIAFVNELSRIFHLLDIDTKDVLAAAGTKWNFLNFSPGLVGGHCIGVDPYYLTHRSERAGYHPQVILAGRRINDSTGEYVAREGVRLMLKAFGQARPTLQLGLTFKEDVPDLRNSKAADIVRELANFNVPTQVADPMASSEVAVHEYGLALTPLEKVAPVDVVVIAVAHRQYVDGGWPFVTSLLRDGRGVVLDVKGVLDRAATPEGVTLWRM
jgi:UDP-N-acetyl-D-glucosamine/UDP-N-acetyl-D-galactosamine dehydrogenase